MMEEAMGITPIVFVLIILLLFEDSLRVRVYHEILGNLGDYVIQRTGGITRVR
jgi:hypothetical protein